MFAQRAPVAYFAGRRNQMVKQAKAPAAGKAAKPVLASAPPMFQAPPATPNAFSAFVAAQKQALAAPMAPVPVAVKAAASAVPKAAKAPKYVHKEQNGRKDYQPDKKGRDLWDMTVAKKVR